MLFELTDDASVCKVNDFISGIRAQKKIVGLASGCFDLIHFQHVSFFARCRRFCDYLIVGVDSDETVREEKGPTRPVIPDFQRAIMVDMLRPVSFAFIMNGITDFGKAAEKFKPDIIFKNDKFKDKEDEIVGKEHAGRIVIIEDQVYHNSTTEIIQYVSKKTVTT